VLILDGVADSFAEGPLEMEEVMVEGPVGIPRRLKLPRVQYRNALRVSRVHQPGGSHRQSHQK
jgi:hypothetical protein